MAISKNRLHAGVTISRYYHNHSRLILAWYSKRITGPLGPLLLKSYKLQPSKVVQISGKIDYHLSAAVKMMLMNQLHLFQFLNNILPVIQT